MSSLESGMPKLFQESRRNTVSRSAWKAACPNIFWRSCINSPNGPSWKAVFPRKKQEGSSKGSSAVMAEPTHAAIDEFEAKQHDMSLYNKGVEGGIVRSGECDMFPATIYQRKTD